MKYSNLYLVNLSWNLFAGIVLVCTSKGDLIVTVIWFLLVLFQSLMYAYSLAGETAKATYRRYERAANSKARHNTIIPILGPIRNTETVAGQSIYNGKRRRAVNIVSLPSLVAPHRTEGQMVFAYLLIVEHEVLHGISSRLGLQIPERGVAHLQRRLASVPYHWSHSYRDDASFRTMRELNIDVGGLGL